MEVVHKEVIIRTVNRTKFSGISYHSGTGTSITGAQLGKQGYKTGLTREEQVKYCKELGLPEGTLASSNGKFWGELLNIRLAHNKPYTFTVDSLMDKIKLGALLENNIIAKTLNDLNTKTEFYIEDKEALAVIEEVKITLQMDALETMRKLSPAKKKGFLKLYGRKALADASESLVSTELFKEVNKDPKKFMGYHDNKDIDLRISIEEMLESGILIKKGYFYHYAEETIGNSMDSVIAFFKDPKNQAILLAAKGDKQVKQTKKK